MSAALELYAQLTEAPDEKTRARLIADAFDALEARFPQIHNLATQNHVSESELRLQKEIVEVEARLQKEIREVEARLQKEIREVEARLQKEIEQVRAELKLDIEQCRSELTLQIEQNRGEIARVKADLLKWLVPLMFTQILAIAAIVKWF